MMNTPSVVRRLRLARYVDRSLMLARNLERTSFAECMRQDVSQAFFLSSPFSSALNERCRLPRFSAQVSQSQRTYDLFRVSLLVGIRIVDKWYLSKQSVYTNLRSRMDTVYDKVNDIVTCFGSSAVPTSEAPSNVFIANPVVASRADANTVRACKQHASVANVQKCRHLLLLVAKKFIDVAGNRYFILPHLRPAAFAVGAFSQRQQ